MAFIHLANISLAFSDRDILKNVNFGLNTGERKAVAGVNGSGKSTLLKILGGLITPDNGEYSKSPETRIGYLSQHGITHTGSTLREEAEKAFFYFHENENLRRKLEGQISEMPEGSDELNGLLDKHHSVLEMLQTSGYYHRNAGIETVFSGLGFSNDDFDRKTESFSGGWQMRIALGKLLLSNPDFLLLDEPTNYLDLEARNWLESFLLNFRGGFCIVSHDRFFLDSTVKEVIEVFLGSLKVYRGTYSQFEKTRDERLAQLEKEYKLQQIEIKKHEEFINRFRYKDSKASLVQSRIKMLEKIVPVEIPPGYKHISINFPPPPHSGKHMVRIHGLTKNYDSLDVISNFDADIMRGEKIVLAGPNGAGKSTLMRIIAGKDQNFSGNLAYGTDVRIGYFSQEFDKEITGSMSIIQFMETHSPSQYVPKLRDMLGAFLFHGDDIHKSLSVLSGGEKSRVALLKLLLSPVNLLILDEPTNHLDLMSKDILFKSLEEYTGTVIFVSHDRDFISQLATRVINLDEKPPKSYPGDYEYFLSQYRPSEITSKIESAASSQTVSSVQLSREERKKIKMLIKKLTAREEEILEKIDSVQTSREKLLSQLSEEGIYTDGEKVKELKAGLSSADSEEQALHTEWETVAEELSLLHDSITEG